MSSFSGLNEQVECLSALYNGGISGIRKRTSGARAQSSKIVLVSTEVLFDSLYLERTKALVNAPPDEVIMLHRGIKARGATSALQGWETQIGRAVLLRRRR